MIREHKAMMDFPQRLVELCGAMARFNFTCLICTIGLKRQGLACQVTVQRRGLVRAASTSGLSRGNFEFKTVHKILVI